MVDMCPVVKWWSENRTEESLLKIQNVKYSNGPLSHMTLPFEYWIPILSGVQMDLVFRCSVCRWLLYLDLGLDSSRKPHLLGTKLVLRLLDCGGDFLAVSLAPLDHRLTGD